MALADYIINVEHQEGDFSVIESLKNEFKGIVKKFDGTINHEFKLTHGYHISVPKEQEEKFKDAINLFGKNPLLEVHVEKDSQVKAN